MIEAYDDRGITARLAGHVVSVHESDIPASAMAIAASCLIDTLGVVLAGSAMPEARQLREVAMTLGGTPTSWVAGESRAVDPVRAALINAGQAHQLDFDDVHDLAAVHASAVAVPAALAAAGLRPEVTLGDVLSAVVVGDDLICRLGLGITDRFVDKPWMRPQVLGVFGGAAVAGRVLGLDKREVENAFGVALPQASGTRASIELPGSGVRAMRDGFATSSGVLAALMAQAGFQGDREPFEGTFGLFRTFYPGSYDTAALLDGLGERFKIEETTFKPWPSARPTHNAIEAALELRNHPRFLLSDVEEVRLTVGEWTFKLCGGAGGFVPPAERMDALVSIPFLVALALMDGAVTLESLRTPSAHAERLAPVFSLMSFDVRERTAGSKVTMEPTTVELVMSDGSVLAAESTHAIGHPSNPLTPDAIDEKFIACGQHAGLAAADLRSVAAGVRTMDLDRPIDELLALLRGSAMTAVRQ